MKHSESVRWVILAGVLVSVWLTVAAGIFVFVSYAERDVTVRCEERGLPWEGEGRLVLPSGEFVTVYCQERVSYWWQGD